MTSVCWVPKGKCNIRGPGKGNDEEKEEMHGGAASSSAAADTNTNTDGLEEFNLDNYDDDEDGGMQFFQVLKADSELAKDADPFMKGNPDSDSESEEDFEIHADDQVFIAVSCEEEMCNLELYVFDEDEASMYVHHDIMLDAYPLCIEWLSSTASLGEGNFGAVGLIDHTIQIWDLDDMDATIEPCLMLGEKKKKKGLKNKARRKKALDVAPGPKAHDGPVLCLHSSAFNRSVLASGSGDNMLKVWDVGSNACVHSYSHHSNKVQCVRWHPTEQAVLLSAAFDRRLGLLDVRQPGQVAWAPLAAEAESAVWSRHRPFECLTSVDNGFLTCYDVRKVANKAPPEEMTVWSMQAHDVACTTVQDAPAPNCLVTAGLDGVAKVWEAAGTVPRLVMEKNLQAGPIFASQSSPEAPALLCFGGSCPIMWDLSSEQVLTSCFKLDGGSAS